MRRLLRLRHLPLLRGRRLLAKVLPPPKASWLWEHVADERRPNSRTACQIKASPALQGLVVHLPATQE